MRPYLLRSARIGFGTWSRDNAALAAALWGDSRVTRLLGGPFTALQIGERLGFRRAENELYPPTGPLHPSYRMTRRDFESSEASSPPADSAREPGVAPGKRRVGNSPEAPYERNDP